METKIREVKKRGDDLLDKEYTGELKTFTVKYHS